MHTKTERGRMGAVLRAMRELVEDAEQRPQPPVARREFVLLREQAMALRALWFAGPPDRGEVAELTRRAIAAQLYCAENS